MARMLRMLTIVILLLIKVSLVSATEVTQGPLFLAYEQRILFSYALIAQGQSDEQKIALLERLSKVKSKYLAKGHSTVQVKNFEEFLNLYRGAWPSTQSLDLDLQLIENSEARGMIQFKAESPRVQKKIDKYIVDANMALLKMAKNFNPDLAIPQSLEGAQSLVTLLGSGPEFSPNASVLLLGKTVLDMADSALSAQLNSLDQIGEQIANSDLNAKGDGSLKILLETMFSEYFKRLSPESKKQIVSAFIGEDLRCNTLRKFELMVQNSGPQLQKLLQAVASEKKDLSPEMLDIFKRLEDSVREVPWVQVKELLDAERANYEFLYFERKPIGIGTMAQVHRAKIKWRGKKLDVVARFIKPDIEKRIMEDHRILTEVAEILDANPEMRKLGVPRLGPLVSDITKTVTAELVQPDTIARQKTAMRYYEKSLFFDSPTYKNTLKVHVPEVYVPAAPSHFMVQEMVIGKKLDKEAATFENSIPDLKKVISEQIAELWIQEVMFGSGFFHSDLHQGNFMVRVTDPEIQVSLLDYGMGGILPKAMRERVITLGAGLDLLDERLIAESYLAISNKSKNLISKDQFKAEVRIKIDRIKKGWEPRLGIDKWTSWVLDLGISLPYDFISLNRGVMIITRMLADSGSGENMTSLTKKVAMKNPIQSYEILRDVGRVPMTDMAKLAWIQMTGKTPIIRQTAVRCEAVFAELQH